MKERAFEKWIDKSGECWLWTGGVDKDGYGAFNYLGRVHRAPRIALELDGRPVPTGMYACHHCDNPRCVKPNHLYVGTAAQNAADTITRGRYRNGRKAKLTPDQVRLIRTERGTHETIASKFGISRAAVSLIKEHKTWRRLP